MNKKIFSLLLVIFVLISLSAVSATELNDDKSIIYSSDDNAILSVDAKTFSDLSNDINGKDSITLESDYQYNESDEAALNNGYIDITKDITIDGNENGIYPTSSGKLFNISENVSVTIKNTIITGDGDSPRILLNNNSAVYLNNCKLINNKYEKSPFIGLNDEIGSMTIENSDIINNTVYTLFLSKVMTINSNRIINNTMDGFESTQEIVVNDNVFLANQDLYSNAMEKLIMEGDYWGTNDAQSIMKEYAMIVPHRFAFTHASLNIDYPKIKYIGETGTITLSIDNDKLPEFEIPVALSNDNAEINATTITLGGGKTVTIAITLKNNGTSELIIGQNYGVTNEDTIETHLFEIYNKGDWYFNDEKIVDLENITIDLGGKIDEAVIKALNNTIPQGTEITVTVGEDIFTTNTTDDKGSFVSDLSSVESGTYDITFHTEGYEDASTTLVVNTQLNLIGADDAKVGDAKTIIANVTAKEGNLTLYVNGKKNQTVRVNNKTASIELGELEAGNYTVYAEFSDETGKYTPATSEEYSFEITKYATSISLNENSYKIYAKENITVLYEITPNNDDIPVNFTIADESIASFDDGLIKGIIAGNTTAQIIITENDKYLGSNATITVEVMKIDEYDANISSDVNEVILALPEDATGNVAVYVNGELYETVAVENGEASTTLKKPGNYTVRMDYEGDNVYASKSNETSLEITKMKSDISMNTQDINVTDKDSPVAIITMPGAATGNITINVNGKEYVVDINSSTVKGLNGILVMPLRNTDLPAGEYNITATYNGDEYFLESTANGTFKILKLEYELDYKYNGTTVVVTLPEDATGEITLDINGTVIKAPLINGTATFDITDVPLGPENATIFYPGDDTYIGFEDVVPMVTEKGIVLTVEDLIKYYGNDEKVNLKVTDCKLVPYANQKVNITINGKSYSRTTDENGTASFAVNLGSGEYEITAEVNGTNSTGKVTILPTVNGTDIVKVLRNGTQYYATFVDSNGKYLADGTEVQFNINGVLYNRKVNGNEGLAKLNINLPQGEYIITAINLVTGENGANKITVISRIIENNDITKYFRNETQYTVKVIGDDGNPVSAGEKVIFNINGVFYTRETNASGIAKLNINLKPGEYIITAEYGGCKVANNIKVLPVLTANDLHMNYKDGSVFEATLVDGQGTPSANQKIEFNINGVFYYRITNSAGVAKLNINLEPGSYIITSTYNGCSISNTITVNDHTLTGSEIENIAKTSINNDNFKVGTATLNSNGNWNVPVYDSKNNLITTLIFDKNGNALG